MMRSMFDAQLEQLNAELISMGAMIERAIDDACRALIQHNVRLAGEVYRGDDAIDQKERQIEAICLRLLLQQQPVARDLRLVSAAMKMITDMERIGDQAQDIAEIVTFLDDAPSVHAERIAGMAEGARRMVHRAIDAFVGRDQALARDVIDADDQIDALFKAVKQALAEQIQHAPQCAETSLDWLMIAKYFERIGDHAVNIAEWVEFSITGMYKGEALQ